MKPYIHFTLFVLLLLMIGGQSNNLASATHSVAPNSFAIIPSAQSETVFLDDFSDGYADGWSPAAGTWTVLTEVSYVPYAQTSDIGGMNNNFVTFYTQEQFVDFIIEVEITSTTSLAPGNFNVGVALRGSGPQNYYRVIFHPNVPGGDLRVEKFVNGSKSIIVSNTNFTTPSTFNTLKIIAQDSTFEAYVNDIFVTSWTDHTFSTGFVGLTTENCSANFDNIKVTTLYHYTYIPYVSK